MAQDILKLLDSLEASVRLAFLASLNDIKGEIKLATIIRHLENGRLDNALSAIALDESFFTPFDEAIRTAYIQGGANALAGLPVIPDPFPVTALLSASTSETRALSSSSEPDLQSSSPVISSTLQEGPFDLFLSLECVQENPPETSPWTLSVESIEPREGEKED